MPVSLPHPLTDGTTAYGSQVRSNDDTIAAKFTEGANGISDADIANGAAIKGSKLSNTAGNRVPFDRIEDDAVTFDKLRDDAATDSNRAVGRNHIRDLAISKAKVSTTAGEKLAVAQLELKSQDVTVAYGPITNRFLTSIVPVLVNNAGNYRVEIRGAQQNTTNNVIEGIGAINADPATPIPVASNTVLAVIVTAASGFGLTSGSITVRIVYLPNT